jgi:hypothetical protein
MFGRCQKYYVVRLRYYEDRWRSTLTVQMIYLTLVRKEAWEVVRGFTEDLAFREDYDFWLRMATKGWR